MDLSLAFLKKGQWQMVELADDPEKPDAYKRLLRTLTSDQPVRLTMRSRGGFIAHIRPVGS